MAAASATPWPHGDAARLRSWLREAWERIAFVESQDPIRVILNRGLVPVYMVFAALAVFLLPVLGGAADRITVLLTLMLIGVAFYLNRHHGVYGPLLLTCVVIMAIMAFLRPSIYTTSTGRPHPAPAELLVPVMIAAIFVSPRAGVAVSVSQYLLLALSALAGGVDPSIVANFLVFGGVQLVGLTSVLVVGATQIIRALRRAGEANAVLEQRVLARTSALADANAELVSAKARIEQGAAAKVREVTEVVHDARNQLGQIRASVDTLADAADVRDGRNARAVRAQRSVDVALRAQQDLLDAMLEAALLDAGALRLNPERAAPADLLERTVAQARPAFEQRRCELLVEVAGPVPPMVCDERRIGRVLQNLLSNALKYTSSYRSEGGLVRVTLLRAGGEIVVRVVDNGAGIAPEHTALLGRRFMRVASGVSDPEGTGIGLSASMGIVALHGGTLRLTSEGVGRGATAELRLPICGPGA